jgi:hypothetical protein
MVEPTSKIEFLSDPLGDRAVPTCETPPNKFLE